MSVDRIKELVQEGLRRKLTGDLSGAADAWAQVLSLDPSNKRAREGLAELEIAGVAPAPRPAAAAPFSPSSTCVFGASPTQPGAPFDGRFTLPFGPPTAPPAAVAPGQGAAFPFDLAPSPALESAGQVASPRSHQVPDLPFDPEPPEAPAPLPGAGQGWLDAEEAASTTLVFGAAARPAPAPPPRSSTLELGLDLGQPAAEPGVGSSPTMVFGLPPAAQRERGRMPAAFAEPEAPKTNPFGQVCSAEDFSDPQEGPATPEAWWAEGRGVTPLGLVLPEPAPAPPAPGALASFITPLSMVRPAAPAVTWHKEPAAALEPATRLERASAEIELDLDVEVDLVPEEPPRASDPGSLLAAAADLLNLDDYSGAMAAVETVIQLDPGNATAQELRGRCESTLLAMTESKLGDMTRKPKTRLKPDEVVWLNLDHRAGFLLSLIDGTVSFEDLFVLSSMPRLETAKLLLKLLQEKAIV